MAIIFDTCFYSALQIESSFIEDAICRHVWFAYQKDTYFFNPKRDLMLASIYLDTNLPFLMVKAKIHQDLLAEL
jgi:hypothetical protein